MFSTCIKLWKGQRIRRISNLPMLPTLTAPMSDSLSLPPGLSFNNTIGAVEIGIIVSIALFGILSIQIFHYYNNYENDKWYLKAMVSSDSSTALVRLMIFHREGRCRLLIRSFTFSLSHPLSLHRNNHRFWSNWFPHRCPMDFQDRYTMECFYKRHRSGFGTFNRDRLES